MHKRPPKTEGDTTRNTVLERLVIGEVRSIFGIPSLGSRERYYLLLDLRLSTIRRAKFQGDSQAPLQS